jgi:lipopolysaccharide biosynthesis glycosyltransferase
MGRYAVCLVTDDKYMLPTVVAALQARAAAPGEDIDVFVFALGLSPEAARRYEDICAAGGVKLVLVTRGIFGGEAENSFIDTFFADSPFTFGALGRFFLDQLLPPEYDQILYIDGDIQLGGSLAELVRAEVPEGRFLAAPDPKVFWIDDGSPAAAREQSYMAGLGMAPEEFGGYFNSGVLRISRSGWRAIGLAAWTYLQENADRCVCHDQSALNAVARAHRLPLSLRWNFPAYYDFYGLRPHLRPVLTHFMSRPKPWNGAFPPWGAAQHKVYLDFVAAHPDLAGDLHRFGFRKTLRYHLQQRVKWVDEQVHGQRRRTVSRRTLAYEATTFA